MSETELQRPQMKIDATPLKEEDKYDFLPYIDREADILPSKQDSWETDERAKAFMKALKAGEDLSDTDWSGINLKGADLSGANLYGVKLSKANLMNANLSGTNLEWTDLSYAYCENTDFSDANMKNVQMKGVFYKNCKIDGADIDEDTMKYLLSVEWFIGQIEKGKIKLDEIPQDQLNYLDLRTMDLSKVEIPEDIDLSALVLEGVNLSGVYIPKGHFLNMALMAKENKRTTLIAQRSQKAQELMLLRLKDERKQAIQKYGEEQKKRTLYTREYALELPRPKAKETPASTTATDVKITTETPKTKTKGKPLNKLAAQAKKIKIKTNSKKRA